MLPLRQYRLLVGLFPVIYIVHNAEEWIVFNRRIAVILNIIPANFMSLLPNEAQTISVVFGIALFVATIIPLIVAMIIWNKPSILNVKILLVIAFITLINAISHISSSFALGFISPGFITGILLCIPFSIVIIYSIRKYYKFSMKQYLLFGFSSIMLFLLGIGLSWSIGLLIVSR